MVSVSGRRRSIIFFSALGICLVVLAVVLNVGWIANWRTGVMYVLGLLFFLAIIAGLVLNTIFLIREIRRNEQHDNFINAMTHELKTPVASIRLYLETLQKRELAPEKRKEFYQIMLEDSDRLLNTIEQVLRAGRVSRSAKLVHRARVDLREIVQECVQLARTRNHLPAECISMSSLAKDAVVLGEPDELKGAIMNLLDNAIKYSSKRVNVRVSLEVDRQSREALIQVKDDGIGIPKTELKHVFKRFYRVPGSVTIRVKGTGLGLFIVRSVAEKHGGKVTADSAGAGQGSVFRLRLPLAVEAEADAAAAKMVES
jgi:two-component system, OmpR family, sensor histidine kinase SenX3